MRHSVLKLEEKIVALQFHDALVVVHIFFPFEFHLDVRVEEVVANALVFDVELYFVDGGYLELRKYPFF